MIKQNITDQKIKDWILSQIQNSNKPRFRERLESVRDIIEFIETDPTEFIKNAVDNKNSYVHYERNRKNILNGFKLWVLTLKMHILVKALLCTQLGLPKELIENKLKSVAPKIQNLRGRAYWT